MWKMANTGRSYQAVFTDYAAEGLRYFLHIQTYIEEAVKEYEFVAPIKPLLAVGHPSRNQEFSGVTMTDKEAEGCRVYQISGDYCVWCIHPLPMVYLNPEALKHAITQRFLEGMLDRANDVFDLELTLIGRKEEQTNKVWIKENLQAWSKQVLALAK